MTFAHALVLLGGFLTVARVTRFITADLLAVGFRNRVRRRFGPTSKAADLIECPWCASIWVGVPVAAIATWVVPWPLPGWVTFIGLWLSWSYVYGLLASNLDGD